MHRTFLRSIVNSFTTAISTSLHFFRNKYNGTFPMLDVIRTKYFQPLRTRSTKVFIKYKYTILLCKIICSTIYSYVFYYHYVIIDIRAIGKLCQSKMMLRIRNLISSLIQHYLELVRLQMTLERYMTRLDM